MTAYTAIPDSDIDPDSPGTTGLFTLIRDNPVAIMEKASGAPVLANGYVVKVMLATDSVVQAKIDTAVGSASGTLNSPGASANVAMNPYCFFPMIYTETNTITLRGHSTDISSGDSPRFGFVSSDASSVDYAADWRYMVA